MYADQELELDQFQFNESALLEMSELDISIGSSGSPSPRLPQSRRCEQRDWRSLLRKAEDEDVKGTIIHDNIHGYIEVPSVCQAIIDTPQFDRLRGLRQLGSAHFVYPAAKHSRWEHSLGVMHLAGEMVDHLIRVQPGCADETDRVCVMLAGLCHDLGHGPFSHLFESFVREARNGYEWCHEKTSIDMLDFIIKENNLMPILENNGMTEKDVTFVKELIYGPFQQGSDNEQLGNWPYVGRGPEKYFLYEIVANKISSVDVDKWDYMLRDNLALQIGVTFDYKRFILHSNLMDIDGRKRMCIRDKEAESVKDMFLDRARLHRKGYQHRTILTIDRMILDALLAADDHYFIQISSGQKLKLSEACDNIEAFAQLTDEYVTRSIQFSHKPEFAQAKAILNRISRRQLYKNVGEIEFAGKASVPLNDAKKKLQELVEEDEGLAKEDLTILRKRVNMGMGEKNPVEKVLFFGKSGKVKSLTSDSLRKGFPRELNSENYIVISRNTDEKSIKIAKKIFKAWTKEIGASREDANLSIEHRE